MPGNNNDSNSQRSNDTTLKRFLNSPRGCVLVCLTVAGSLGLAQLIVSALFCANKEPLCAGLSDDVLPVCDFTVAVFSPRDAVSHQPTVSHSEWVNEYNDGKWTYPLTMPWKSYNKRKNGEPDCNYFNGRKEFIEGKHLGYTLLEYDPFNDKVQLKPVAFMVGESSLRNECERQCSDLSSHPELKFPFILNSNAVYIYPVMPVLGMMLLYAACIKQRSVRSATNDNPLEIRLVDDSEKVTAAGDQVVEAPYEAPANVIV